MNEPLNLNWRCVLGDAVLGKYALECESSRKSEGKQISVAMLSRSYFDQAEHLPELVIETEACHRKAWAKELCHG